MSPVLGRCHFYRMTTRGGRNFIVILLSHSLALQATNFEKPQEDGLLSESWEAWSVQVSKFLWFVFADEMNSVQNEQNAKSRVDVASEIMWAQLDFEITC